MVDEFFDTIENNGNNMNHMHNNIIHRLLKLYKTRKRNNNNMCMGVPYTKNELYAKLLLGTFNNNIYIKCIRLNLGITSEKY